MRIFLYSLGIFVFALLQALSLRGGLRIDFVLIAVLLSLLFFSLEQAVLLAAIAVGILGLWGGVRAADILAYALAFVFTAFIYGILNLPYKILPAAAAGLACYYLVCAFFTHVFSGLAFAAFLGKEGVALIIMFYVFERALGTQDPSGFGVSRILKERAWWKEG